MDFKKIINLSLNQEDISREDCLAMLSSKETELLPLLQAVYEVRKKFLGNIVTIHIINNVQNGFCPEDCAYCAQSNASKTDIEEYSVKSDEEILKEAENAYKKGAFRYCMVFAGRGPNARRTEHIAQLIKKIKSAYPIEVCVSAGLLDQEKACVLKEAGLDRLNHNLNTSEEHYEQICSTHTYEDRLNTLKAARGADLKLCSGMIVGMNETHEDIVQVAKTLRQLEVESIPVNFMIPIEGTRIKTENPLTPEFCLRILCLFRFLNPKSELRIAAGREMHLRSLQVMALYPASSLFLDGYLNARGDNALKTLQMIKDAGFTIKSEIPIEELLNKPSQMKEHSPSFTHNQNLKALEELRPFLNTK